MHTIVQQLSGSFLAGQDLLKWPYTEEVLTDELAMEFALAEASKAESKGDVPVGAVIVSGGQIVGKGYNTREDLHDPLGHAEINAIKDASKQFESWRIENATIYVTLEPCLMCAGAIFAARIDRLVFGATDPKWGVFGSADDLSRQNRMNHTIAVTSGVQAHQAKAQLQSFFQNLRT